jgi:DNA-binding winged helix-turn-helix (wHTH) protein
MRGRIRLLATAAARQRGGPSCSSASTAAHPDRADTCYRFGCCELRPCERRLLIGGQDVHLGSRAFDVLVTLIERRASVVTKDELLDSVWHGMVVEEANVQVQVSALRKVIGPRAVATIHRRGYRFAMVVEDPPAARSF